MRWNRAHSSKANAKNRNTGFTVSQQSSHRIIAISCLIVLLISTVLLKARSQHILKQILGICLSLSLVAWTKISWSSAGRDTGFPVCAAQGRITLTIALPPNRNPNRLTLWMVDPWNVRQFIPNTAWCRQEESSGSVASELCPIDGISIGIAMFSVP